MIELFVIGIPRGHKERAHPTWLVERLTSAEELDEKDREAILQIAQDTLTPFQP